MAQQQFGLGGYDSHPQKLMQLVGCRDLNARSRKPHTAVPTFIRDRAELTRSAPISSGSPTANHCSVGRDLPSNRLRTRTIHP